MGMSTKEVIRFINECDYSQTMTFFNHSLHKVWGKGRADKSSRAFQNGHACVLGNCVDISRLIKMK